MSKYRIRYSVNLSNRIKTSLNFGVCNRLTDQWVVSAHFYYVRCHCLQWDESRLLHVDFLLISNYPWEILRTEMHKCETACACNYSVLKYTQNTLKCYQEINMLHVVNFLNVWGCSVVKPHLDDLNLLHVACGCISCMYQYCKRTPYDQKTSRHMIRSIIFIYSLYIVHFI